MPYIFMQGWKYIFILVCALLLKFSCFAQSGGSKYSSDFTIPEFSKDRDAFDKYIRENIQLPVRTDCTDGNVTLLLTIDSLGYVSKIIIRRGLCDAYNQEATRLLLNMPQWIPGTRYGKPITTNVQVRVSFKPEFYKN